MWTFYDPDADMAYILFADAHPGQAAITLMDAKPAQTEPAPPAIAATFAALTLEFDGEGRLIGIEVENASGALPDAFLQKAAGEKRPRPQSSK